MDEPEKPKQQRNVEGLRRRARERHEAARYKCREALKIMLRKRQRINFKTVADAANVSTGWLYTQADIRGQIEHLRENYRPKVSIPKPERASDDSRNSMIAALRLRIMNLEEEVKELRVQNEVAYGLIEIYRQQKETVEVALVPRKQGL